MKKLLNILSSAWRIQTEIDKARKELKTLKELENEYHKKLENPDCSATIRKYSKLLEEVREAQTSCCTRLGRELLGESRNDS